MKRNKGFALVTVLWILAILTVLTLGFGHRALLDHRAAVTTADHHRCLEMAYGACNYGVAVLRNQATLTALYDAGGIEIPPPVWMRYPDLINDLRVYQPGDPALYSDDEATARIIDEESRISLNDAPEDLLDGIDEMSFTTVNDIMRRRESVLSDDPNATRSFQAVEEMRDFDGISDRDWLGDEDDPGLRDLFTVYGDGKININTASREVMAAIPDLDEDIAEAIAVYRAGPDGDLQTSDDRQFRSFTDIPVFTSVDPNRIEPIATYCKLESQFFTVVGSATLRQGKVRAQVKAVVEITGDSAVIHSWTEGVEDGDFFPGQ